MNIGDSKKEYKRVTMYVPNDLVRKLKSKLSLRGLSMSAWFRHQARNAIAKTTHDKTVDSSYYD